VKILKVSQAYHPFLAAGGPPTKIRAIATRLVQHGHQVTVLTADLGLRRNGSDSSHLELDRWGWMGSDEGVQAIYLPTLARYRALTLNPGVVGFCREKLGSFALAHIYGLYDLLGPQVARPCSSQRIPYLVEPMGMFRPIVRNLLLKQAYHRIFGDRLMRGARFVIATSQQERQELAADGIDETRIVIRRNGIESPEALPEAGEFRRRLGLAEDARVILFLGRLVAKKNPDILIAAFARWRANAGNAVRAVLVLAGPEEDAAYARQLRESCVELRLGVDVRFTGPLYGEEKWQAYRDADVFVLPSQNENFGNTAGEAAACGTPVIVTDQCGIAPWIEGKAGVVVRCEADAIENALATMLANARLREEFREGCARVTRELSWDQPVAQMESLYQQCVEENAGR
jgi:glycosyltransferase involved in cell wall biosynthesis